MDYVTNHWGTQHWMVKDPPTKGGFIIFEYTNTNHRKEYILIHMHQ